VKKTKVLGVIPARLNSTRLARKMLADINGKPLIWHTWNQARKAKLLDAVVVATDSVEIREALLKLGVTDVVMTSSKINTGSDRVAAAAKLFKKFKPDIVINIQGDQPMVPSRAIDQTVSVLLKNPKALVSTIATSLKNKDDFQNPGCVKVVLNKKGEALYFSRSLIPFPRENAGVKVLWHFGIYGYRANFLQQYVKMPQTPLEKTELLEQLRILENGYPISVGVGTYDFTEVNVAAELDIVRKLLKKK
jgi:3-deoxy-manno-octulosonate cytidylyltransferase (CMP-KDO synthetase)